MYLFPTLAEIAEVWGAGRTAAAYRTRLLAAATGSEECLQLYRSPLALMLVRDVETVVQVLSLAEDDVAVRPDEAGLTVLEWVLHRSGRAAQAMDAAKRAVESGALRSPAHCIWRVALCSVVGILCWAAAS